MPMTKAEIKSTGAFIAGAAASAITYLIDRKARGDSTSVGGFLLYAAGGAFIGRAAAEGELPDIVEKVAGVKNYGADAERGIVATEVVMGLAGANAVRIPVIFKAVANAAGAGQLARLMMKSSAIGEAQPRKQDLNAPQDEEEVIDVDITP